MKSRSVHRSARNVPVATLVAAATQLVTGVALGQVLEPVGEPELLWRSDGPALPPNTFGKYRNAFSPDGRMIGIIHQPDEAWLLDTSDGSLVRELPYSTEFPSAYSVAFSSSNLMAIGRWRYAEVLDLQSVRSVRLIRCEICLAIDSVTFSPDNSLLAFQSISSYTDDEIYGVTVADIRTGEALTVIDALSSRPKVSFSPDGRYLVASAISESSGALGFRVWETDSWAEMLEFRGEPGTSLGVMATALTEEGMFIAVYGREGVLEMRDLVDNRVAWATPLIRPMFAPSGSTILGTELDRVEIAPNGQFLITYESPIAHDPIGHVSGGIVVRDIDDGSVTAIYDVYGVTGLSISPDSTAFVYSTGAGQVHTALARVPGN